MFRNGSRIALLVTACGVSACGGARASVRATPPSKAAGAGPTVTAEITPDAAWPFHVDRTALMIDGAPWSAASTPTLSVGVGEHTVVALVELSMPCDAFGATAGHVHMRTVRTFSVAPGDDASVRVALVDHGVLVPVTDRLGLVVTPVGAHGVPGTADEPRFTECASATDARDHAQCVLGPLLATARAIGDHVASDCVESALTRVSEPHLRSELRAIERAGVACIAWEPLEDGTQVASDCGAAP